MTYNKAKPTVLRLAIVTNSTEESEEITNYLRNNGVAVRLYKPESVEDLSNTLNSSAGIDMIILKEDKSNNELSLKNIKQLLSKNKSMDCPVITLLDEFDDINFLKDAKNGANNSADRKNMEHIEHVVLHEYSILDERKKKNILQAQIKDYEIRCDALIDSSRDPISYIHEGLHIRANDAYLDFFDLKEFKELEGESLLDLVAEEQITSFKDIIKQMSKGEGNIPAVDGKLQVGGEIREAIVEFSPAVFEGEKCVQVILRKKESQSPSAINQDTLTTDILTGLMNRAAFLEKMESKHLESKNNPENKNGLLLFELDHYPEILQRVGLSNADELIKNISSELKVFSNKINETTTSARVGENQFGLLVENVDFELLKSVAQQLKIHYSKNLMEVKGNSLSVTISVGGVYLTSKIQDITQCLSKAHQLLHDALSESNKINIHDPEAIDKAEQDKINKIIDIINQNIDNESFVIKYQPLIALHGDPCEFYEMQSQIYDENGEHVNYMKIASEQGMLWEIDRWNVAKALEIIKQRKDAGHDTTILLKVSEASIQDDSMISHIEEKINELEVDGGRLILELPESKITTYLKLAQTFRLKLANMNVKVGLSQFGSGVDSSQILNHFGADTVKISHNLSQNLGDDKDKQEKIIQLSSLVKEHGKDVIVENVEDASSMAFLFSAGIHYVMGSFLGSQSTNMDFEF